MIKYKSDVDPSELHPEFRADMENLLLSGKYDWLILFGYRSLELQSTLHSKYLQYLIDVKKNPKIPVVGKAAPPGLSAHNYGLAVDVAPDSDSIKPGFQLTWNEEYEAWDWLYEALNNHPRLKSGVTFQDGGHIEKLNWKLYKGWNETIKNFTGPEGE